MYQRWANLLFLHWSVSPEVIQATLPPGLYVDTHKEQAWLAVVPFFMQGIRPRFCPPVPGLSSFLELNLRTYVHDRHGRPGVWFYSLDANQALAVKIAQTVFSLPYVYARMSAGKGSGKQIELESTRPGAPRQAFQFAPAETIGHAEPGTLEHFLVERYLLFSYRERSRTLYVGRVHHASYPLFKPRVFSYSRDLFRLNGFADPERDHDHALMSPGVDVSVYGLEPVS
jgi:uncharacterized protein YqjF (DUF2071 family)